MSLVKNEHASELFTKTEIPNSPFVAIKTEKACFGAFGRYKITKDYETVEEVTQHLSEITWDKLVIITSLIYEMLKSENINIKPSEE